MNAPKCKDIINLIPLYIDGLLDKEESITVKEHIDRCQDCKKEFEFMLSIMSKTKELPRVTASSDFSTKVVANVKLQKAKKRRTFLLRRISSGVAVAAVLALCVVSFDFFDTNEPPTENTPVLSAEKLPDNPPDIATIPKAEQPKEPQRAVEEKTVVEDKSAEAPADETVASFTPALFSEVELTYYTIATVELTEENTQTVEELIKDYEKDTYGYIVPDMNILLRKFTEAGIKVKTEVSPDITNDYILTQ